MTLTMSERLGGQWTASFAGFEGEGRTPLECLEQIEAMIKVTTFGRYDIVPNGKGGTEAISFGENTEYKDYVLTAVEEFKEAYHDDRKPDHVGPDRGETVFPDA